MRIARAQFIPNHGLRTLLRSMVGEIRERRGRGQISSHRRQRLFSTAAMASDDPKNVQRSPKRVSTQERRAMVESFVNKYRTLNAGKFPTASAAQKEVGGGYYFIREIVHELKYNSLHNPVVEITGDSLVKKKGAENEIIPEEEFSRGGELSCSHSRADGEVEIHLHEVEKVPHAEEKACKNNMQVLGDEVEVEAEVEKVVDAEAQRESAGVKDVHGQPLPGSFVGRTGDVSTDQKLICEEAESNSLHEHANNLSGDEIKKHFESRKMSVVGNFSEKTLSEDTLTPQSKEDKDEFLTASSSLEAEGSSTMPRTGEPVLVYEKAAKSSSQSFVKPNISTSKQTHDQESPGYDGLSETSVQSANDNELKQKPSLWSNLKSFADSVFSIWRKG